MDRGEQLKHLYSRAAFGLPLELWKRGADITAAVDELLKIPAPQPIEVVTQENYTENSSKALKAAMLSTDELKMKQKSFREKTADLSFLWFQQMVQTSYPLQEKMALFWHGHFATRIDNPYFDQLLLHELRSRATGHFGDLLTAVSKSPAMLQFLNNQQNKKQHPNENFAREVMELFTLGRGHYTENDIKEAARAFTGWGYDDSGDFVFREQQHDTGEKTILGRKGNFNGDDVLQLLLQERQTALFITQKLYRCFVNADRTDTGHVQQLANSFYDSNYDIRDLLRRLFTAAWFYEPENVAACIKSPVDLLVGLQRTIPLEYAQPQTLIRLQRILGQQLFYPPNVAGWPGGKAWIDSSSLVLRMRLPEAFFADRELNLQVKEQDAEMMEVNKKPALQNDTHFKVGKVAADWKGWLAYWQPVPPQELPAQMAGFLLPAAVSKQQLAAIERFADNSTPEHYIKSITILLMSLPEYQLS